jgi:hypothetical protein
VIAHIRHVETRYDDLLSRGYERHAARDLVEEEIDRVLTQWEGPSS